MVLHSISSEYASGLSNAPLRLGPNFNEGGGSTGSVNTGYLESCPTLCGDSDIGPSPNHAIPFHSPMASGKDVLKALPINAIRFGKVYHGLDILRV